MTEVSNPKTECFCIELGLTVEELKVQLAEAQALLVKANYVVDHSRTIDKQAFSRGTQNVDHGLFLGLGNLLAQYDEALSASAQPRATVEIDERAEFEGHLKRKGCEWMTQRMPHEHDIYILASAQRLWEGWQARAALERKL